MFYVMIDSSLYDPGLPPYFSGEFIDMIQQADEQKLAIETMTSKNWYDFLVNKSVLQEKTQDGTFIPIKCKAELLYPARDWTKVWSLARYKVISNESRFFLFRLLHNLHPTKARLHRLNPRATPLPFCLFCEDQEKEESLSHIFSSECSQSAQAMEWVKSVLTKFDPNITFEKIISLQLDPTNAACLLECVFFIAETLSIVWEKRQGNKKAELEAVKAVICARAETLKKSARFGPNGTNTWSRQQLLSVFHSTPHGAVTKKNLVLVSKTHL